MSVSKRILSAKCFEVRSDNGSQALSVANDAFRQILFAEVLFLIKGIKRLWLQQVFRIEQIILVMIKMSRPLMLRQPKDLKSNQKQNKNN